MVFRRSGRLPKIDKKTADRQMLHAYYELRNERRREIMMKTIMVTAAILTFVVLALLINPTPSTPIIMGIVAAAGLTVIFGTMFMTAIWAAYGSRGVSVAFVLVVMVLAGGSALGWHWLLGQL